MDIVRKNEKVVQINVDAPEQKYLIIADLHIDSNHCDRKLLIRMLDHAANEGYLIVVVGDAFDLMQNTKDPRANKSSLKDEYKRDDYLDAVKDDATKTLWPYREHIAMILMGNHETAVLRHYGTNMTNRLCCALQESRSWPIPMGYDAWLMTKFKWAGKSYSGHNTYLWHGSGGAAPVTKGVIKAARQNVWLEGVDLSVMGHSHNAWHVAQRVKGLTQKGESYERTVHTVMVPSFKFQGEWETSVGMEPKPRGGAWVTIKRDKPINHTNVVLQLE